MIEKAPREFYTQKLLENQLKYFETQRIKKEILEQENALIKEDHHIRQLAGISGYNDIPPTPGIPPLYDTHNSSAQIIHLLDTQPDKVFGAGEIVFFLKNCVPGTNEPSVYATLRNLTLRGKIAKVRRGTYKSVKTPYNPAGEFK